MSQDWTNKLYFGDNLGILREHVADESVDLIYLDPPFNSNATYNVLFADKSGEKSAAQITAFDDTWHWGLESEAAYGELVTSGPRKLGALLEALRAFLGTNDMMAYLTMMAVRLVELHRVLKPTGSIYLHCDPTASHYLKLLLDATFGPELFIADITWKRTNVHSDAKRWSPVADTILHFGRSKSVTWNPQFQAHDEKYLKAKYRYVERDGRRYRLDNMTSPKPRPRMMYEWLGFPSPPNGWRYERSTMERLHSEGRIWYPDDTTKRPALKRYLDEMKGVILGNVWTDIDPINSQAQERLGYPTQKPEDLLERIISASSIEGDVVLDPFCGCGTAIAVAERMHRRWIGIDVTHLAIALMRHRLQDAFGKDLSPYEVLGAPTDLGGAAALAEQNRFQFEWWALGLVEARPAQDKKKGADQGIDGYIKFFDDESGQSRTVVVQVKSGKVSSRDVRDLKGVLDREKAEIGLLITLQAPTRPMETEAAAAGFYEPRFFQGTKYPRLQILTIEELLEGKQVQYPRMAPTSTFKRAERKEKAGGVKQESLFE